MQDPSILATQRDSKNDSNLGARRELQRRRRHAPSCMGATELQSNWPDMRKTLGKPGFCSGEDRNRTTCKSPGKLALRHHARREIRRAPISLFETTRNTILRAQLATSLQPDLQGHRSGVPIAIHSAFQFVTTLRRGGWTQGNAEAEVVASVRRA